MHADNATQRIPVITNLGRRAERTQHPDWTEDGFGIPPGLG